MPKATADYARLARHAAADVPHFAERVKRVEAEIAKLLQDTPERVKIMQLIGHYAVDKVNHSQAVDAVERYTRLAEKQATEAEQQPATT